MTDADNTPYEILAPSAALLPVATGLRAALDRLSAPDATAPEALYWGEIPFLDFGHELARFALWKRGWEPDGEINASRFGERDLYHHLLTELNIMSEADLNERCRAQTEGAGTSARYARIEAAPTVKTLLTDDMALGWGGVEVVGRGTPDPERVKRERMFVDYFRGALSGFALRASDLSEGASIVAEAMAGDMVGPKEAARLFERTVTEAVVRFSSWHEWAKSLLAAEVFLALETGESAALEVLAEREALLTRFLEGPWGQTPWPRLRASEAMPPVYGQ